MANDPGHLDNTVLYQSQSYWLLTSFLGALRLLQKSVTVPHISVHYFILLASRSFMTPIYLKIPPKTGSGNNSKSYSVI